MPMAGAVEDFVSNPPAPARPSTLASRPARIRVGRRAVSSAGTAEARGRGEAEAIARRPRSSAANPDRNCSRSTTSRYFHAPATRSPFPTLTCLFQKAPRRPSRRQSNRRRRSQPTSTEAADHQRGYVRPAQRQSGNLKYTAIIGTAAIAIAVVAVIVVSEQLEAGRASEGEREGRRTANSATGRGEEGRSGEAREEGRGARRRRTFPSRCLHPASEVAAELKVNPLSAKPELTQRPSGTPVQIEVPFDKVKRFFARESSRRGRHRGVAGRRRRGSLRSIPIAARPVRASAASSSRAMPAGRCATRPRTG